MQIVNKKEKEKVPFSKIKIGECFEYRNPVTGESDIYMCIESHDVIVDYATVNSVDSIKCHINTKPCIEGNVVAFYNKNIQHFSDNTMVTPLKTQLVIMEG